MSDSVFQARGRLGVASRRGDPAAIETARRDLAAAKLEAYIRKVLAGSPPLTPEQVQGILAKLYAEKP